MSECQDCNCNGLGCVNREHCKYRDGRCDQQDQCHLGQKGRLAPSKPSKPLKSSKYRFPKTIRMRKSYYKVYRILKIILRLLVSILNFSFFKELNCLLNRYDILHAWRTSSGHYKHCVHCKHYKRYQHCREKEKLNEAHNCSNLSWSELYRKNPEQRDRLFINAWIQDMKSVIPYTIILSLWAYVYWEYNRLIEAHHQVIRDLMFLLCNDLMVLLSFIPFYLIPLIFIRGISFREIH